MVDDTLEIKLSLDEMRMISSVFIQGFHIETQQLVSSRIKNANSKTEMGVIIMDAIINEFAIKAVEEAVKETEQDNQDTDIDIAYKDDMVKDRDSNSDVNFV